MAGHTPILDFNGMRKILKRLDRSGGEDACWNWTASTTSKGYGQFRIGERNYRAHRLMAAFAFGNIDDDGSASRGRVVMHACDNPKCCNPKHLRLGTQKDNMIDMDRKGRRGSRQSIPPEVITAIRESQEISRVVAARFGLSGSYVREVRRGEARKAG